MVDVTPTVMSDVVSAPFAIAIVCAVFKSIVFQLFLEKRYIFSQSVVG